jgi:peptidoglycan hydrolase-like protein with peptidoglycan-binding domain
MRSNQFKKLGITLLMLAALGASAFASSQSSKSHFRRLHRAAWKRRGQQQIQQDRAREIQAALIREHYLQGQPSGLWDDKTVAAMRRFQAAQGWQSKVVPDSRALIKLGLGPSHENDLNPDLMGDKSLSTFRGTESTPTDLPQQ